MGMIENEISNRYVSPHYKQSLNEYYKNGMILPRNEEGISYDKHFAENPSSLKIEASNPMVPYSTKSTTSPFSFSVVAVIGIVGTLMILFVGIYISKYKRRSQYMNISFDLNQHSNRNQGAPTLRTQKIIEIPSTLPFNIKV